MSPILQLLGLLYWTQSQLELSVHLVSEESKSCLISGGDNSYSWVYICALDLFVKEEWLAVLLGEGVDF